jgi:hypothetical protein
MVARTPCKGPFPSYCQPAPGPRRVFVQNFLLQIRLVATRLRYEVLWRQSDYDASGAAHFVMNFKSILIVTYGRSGSTLLQGILNSIDGCVIRGENYNFCWGLFESYRSMIRAKRFNGDSPQSPWYGSDWDESLFLNRISKMMRELLVGKGIDKDEVSCYGFKEIRYADLAEEEFVAYLDFLKKIFPNVAFIFNTRNLADVVRSGWWRRLNPEASLVTLRKAERMFQAYMSTHDNCYHIEYSDMVTQSSRLIGMFDFIGARYSREKISEILSIPHSQALLDPSSLLRRYQ